MYRNLKLFSNIKYSLSTSLPTECIYIEIDNLGHKIIYHKFNDPGTLYYGEIEETLNGKIRFYIIRSMDTKPDRVVYDNTWNSFEDWKDDVDKEINIQEVTKE